MMDRLGKSPRVDRQLTISFTAVTKFTVRDQFVRSLRLAFERKALIVDLYQGTRFWSLKPNAAEVVMRQLRMDGVRLNKAEVAFVFDFVVPSLPTALKGGPKASDQVSDYFTTNLLMAAGKKFAGASALSMIWKR